MILKYLTSERFSVNHLIVVFLIIAAIEHKNYITAVAILVVGSFVCALLDSTAKE